MTSVHLKYVNSFVDRHGERTRHYFRRPGGKSCPLPGLPGSPEFMGAYNAAIGGQPHQRPVSARPAPGTFSALALSYFDRGDFIRLQSERSKYLYRYHIERFTKEHGHRLVADMTREDVQRIMSKLRETPGMANDMLRRIRALIHFAIDEKIRTDDPTVRIKLFKLGEFHTWTEEEIAAFEAKWPLGTRERTAFALALYTGQRREDLAAMMWTDIAGTKIRVAQEKSQGKTKLVIPLHPKLQEALRAWRRERPSIIATQYGKPYQPSGFGYMMADAIEDAKLPEECVLHGLRKAAARRLAEAGCSAKLIQSITGHKSLKDVEVYTRAAEQVQMAQDAIDRLVERAEEGANLQTRPPDLQTA